MSLPLARPGTLLLALAYFFLGFIFYAVIFAMIGSFGTSQQQSQQVAGTFSVIAMLPFFFSGIFFTQPNSLLARVLSYFPFTTPITMLFRLPTEGLHAVDIVGTLALLILLTPLMLWLAVKFLRLTLLMYGQQPGLRRLLRLFREA